jgi:hypothetical protein
MAANEMKQAIAEAVENALTPRSADPSSRSAIANLGPTDFRGSAIAVRNKPGIVCISRVVLEAAVDSLERAAEATKHAQHISESAASAFGEESKRIQDCISVLKRTLQQR